MLIKDFINSYTFEIFLNFEISQCIFNFVTLPCGVTVAHNTLDVGVGVRIPTGQPNN